MIKLYWKNAGAEMVGEEGGLSQAELERLRKEEIIGERWKA